MITIAKTFSFDAAHSLPMCPEGHKCRRVHGHTYQVEVRLNGLPREDGFVVDYDDIAKAWQPLHEQLDHRSLNDIPGLGRCSSTEHLVMWIFGCLAVDPTIGKLLSAVKVSESSTTWAELTAHDFRQWIPSPDRAPTTTPDAGPWGRFVERHKRTP